MSGAIDPTVTAAAIGSIGSLVAIVLAAVLARRSENGAKVERAGHASAIAEIHVLVNSKMDDAMKRIAALEQRLGLAPGETIPPGTP